jgi:hypothetical protein
VNGAVASLPRSHEVLRTHAIERQQLKSRIALSSTNGSAVAAPDLGGRRWRQWQGSSPTEGWRFGAPRDRLSDSPEAQDGQREQGTMPGAMSWRGRRVLILPARQGDPAYRPPIPRHGSLPRELPCGGPRQSSSSSAGRYRQAKVTTAIASQNDRSRGVVPDTHPGRGLWIAVCVDFDHAPSSSAAANSAGPQARRALLRSHCRRRPSPGVAAARLASVPTHGPVHRSCRLRGRDARLSKGHAATHQFAEPFAGSLRRHRSRSLDERSVTSRREEESWVKEPA